MAVQANFPERSSRKVKDWSPIDRMLATKRQSKRSASPVMQRLAEELPQLPPPAPTLPKEVPWEKSKCIASASVQTALSWTAAVAEAVANEKRRADALQKEVRALQERLKESDATKLKYEEDSLRWKALHDNILSDLHEKELASNEVVQASEAEISSLRQQCSELRSEIEDLGRRGGQDVGFLKEQLDKSKDKLTYAQEECQELQMRCDELRKEVAELAGERDILLKRLEDEQAEMMARVDKMERSMKEKPSRGTRSGSVIEQEALQMMATAVNDRLEASRSTDPSQR